MKTRPARLSEGGSGKFNNVDGVITNYEFTLIHPFAKEGRRRSNSNFNPLYGVVWARMDSAKEDDADVMLVGSADDFEINDNGKTLTLAGGNNSLWGKSQWGKFIASMEHLGVETENGDYPEESYNYEPIIGRRVRFTQEQQFDKAGKLKKREGTGRDGKKREYDDTTTVVTADYGMAKAFSGQGTKKTTTTATTTTKSGKANGATKEEVDLTDQADEALVGLLDKFGGSAPKAKLVSAPAQLFLKKNYPEQSDELRKLLYDDDYINTAVERGIISGYEQSGKTQLLTA